MDAKYKKLKERLESIPGVSIKTDFNVESVHFKNAFKSVQNNLNFFKACISRLVTALTETKKIISNIEELYNTKTNGSFYGSELEAFHVLINYEVLKIVNIKKSTKYKELFLLDMSLSEFIGKEKLLIDIYSNEKFEVDFSLFNIDPYSELISEAGINLGAKYKLGDIFSDDAKSKTSAWVDFGVYRFNLERMIDKALSISATLESKAVFLNIIQEACLDEDKHKSEIKEINFLNLNKHAKEDSVRIAQYV